MQLFAEWADATGAAYDAHDDAARAARRDAARQALDEVKALHASNPKYEFLEESQQQVIKANAVEVIDLRAEYLPGSAGSKVHVQDNGNAASVEEFVQRHFERRGYSVMPLESRPFHALFGIYMWLLIQDPDDPWVRIVGFGDRTAFDEGRPGKQILTQLPEDFGTVGYGRRRATAIDEHLSPEMGERDQLEWLFDYWREPSENLRQYLWAHRYEDVASARKLIDVLPPPVIVRILRYLVDHYWGRYCGWPDLLAWKGGDFVLIEVKASRDKLSEDQKRWIRDNRLVLNLPFKLVKVHSARKGRPAQRAHFRTEP